MNSFVSGSIPNKFTELRPMTISQAEVDNSSSLFVVNMSNPSGNIHFDVETRGGNRNLIYVPATTVAIDLSMQAVKADILQSPSFRKYVSVGFIRIVDTKQAEAFMNNPKHQQEFKKAMRYNLEESSVQPMVQVAEPQQENNITDELTPVIIRVAGDDQMSEQEAVEILEQNEHVINIADLQYLVDNAIHTGVKTWAATRLTK